MIFHNILGNINYSLRYGYNNEMNIPLMNISLTPRYRIKGHSSSRCSTTDNQHIVLLTALQYLNLLCTRRKLSFNSWCCDCCRFNLQYVYLQTFNTGAQFWVADMVIIYLKRRFMFVDCPSSKCGSRCNSNAANPDLSESRCHGSFRLNSTIWLFQLIC